MAFSAGSLGCAPKPKSVTIGRIIIDAPRSLDGHQSEREALRTAITERLEHDSGVKFQRDSRDATHILQVSLGNNVAPPDAPPSRPMEVRLKPTAQESPGVLGIGRAAGGAGAGAHGPGGLR